MNFHDSLHEQLDAMGLSEWSDRLKKDIPAEFSNKRHGKMPVWQKAMQALPLLEPSRAELKNRVEIGLAEDLDSSERTAMVENLKVFHPWRKGPFRLFGIDINTEWRSDWKWDRLLPHIQPLRGRKVLDVGCGNGYHGWRMRGEGAALVVGIDPVMLYVLQFQVMQRYLKDSAHHLLPLRMEDLPDELNCFDTVFSMGVLYHRRSPLDHLIELKGCLRPGGELVLETLVVEGDINTVLTPQERYAKMRNVWFIPSVEAMMLWLIRCGYEDVRCIDITRTSLSEQRRTEWMCEESLEDYLDSNDQSKTVEGYPAPIRSVFVARKP